MDKVYKHSQQREAILEVLRDTGIHPTATWIYEQIRGKFPNLSMGTVYRNLNILIEQGLVKKIDSGSTFDRFEAHTEPHYHFICEKCGSIIDLKIPIDPALNEKVNRNTSFKALSHRLDFFGICDQCDKKRTG